MWVALSFTLTLASQAERPSSKPTLQITVGSRALTGTPIAWNRQEVLFLQRSGTLDKFSAAQAETFEQVSATFRPFTQSEMRGILLREFGRRYECSGTGHYLVVHPAGQRDQWAQRFESLYRSFSHYFTARGFRMESPEFPLVAIVLPTRADFAQYARAHRGPTDPRVLGFYAPSSNRVALYDVTAGSRDSERWYINAGTIIHEATHQIAFNTGIHSRYATPPRWLAEGLAMMFEAPGVWNPRHFPNRQDRVHSKRLKAYVNLQRSGQQAGLIEQMVQHPDTVFSRLPHQAYATAWALTFFLSEQEPQKLIRYFALTASREPLSHLSASDRQREFTEVFGSDFKLLEARLSRYLLPLSRKVVP